MDATPGQEIEFEGDHGQDRVYRTKLLSDFGSLGAGSGGGGRNFSGTLKRLLPVAASHHTVRMFSAIIPSSSLSDKYSTNNLLAARRVQRPARIREGTEYLD